MKPSTAESDWGAVSGTADLVGRGQCAACQQRAPPRARPPSGRRSPPSTAVGCSRSATQPPTPPPTPAQGRDAAQGGLGLPLVAGIGAAHGWQITGDGKMLTKPI